MRTMKDSGIEWIGEIPEEWKLCKPKFVGKISSGDSVTNKDLSDGNGYEVLGANGIVGFCSKYNIDGINIIIGRVGSCGKVRISVGKKFVSDNALIFTCASYVNVKYLYYTFEAFELNRLNTSNAQPLITGFKVLNIVIPFPNLREQEKIFSYLDARCSEIDANSEDIQKEINILQDYKKSVITEAVTKGLDPNVEMKDSGINWLPKIPAHWQVMPSKYLFANSDVRRKAGDEQLTASQKYGIIAQKEYTAKENAQVVLATQGLEKWKHVEPNDFIISLRSFQGGLEMSEITGCITWHYVVLKAQKEVYHKYYKWLFKSAQYINALQGTCNFIRDGQDLRFSNFALVPLFELPLSEQQEIADYLDARCSEIDALIADKKKQLELLAEYKKSLIYEYVTGKKEVAAQE